MDEPVLAIMDQARCIEYCEWYQRTLFAWIKMRRAVYPQFIRNSSCALMEIGEKRDKTVQ